MSRRLRPPINQDTQFLWDGFEADEFRIQHCMGCQELRHPPGPACPSCHSFAWDYAVASGRGTVYSYVNFPPPGTALREAESHRAHRNRGSTRFISNLVEIDPDAIEIGMPVEVVFTQVDDELKLPLFKPSEA